VGDLHLDPELSAQADTELARRALPGVWANIGMVQFLLFGSDYFKNEPIVASIFAVVTLAACVFRVFIILRKDLIYSVNPRRWRVLLATCVGVTSSSWGVLSGYTYILYGHSNWSSLLLTFCILGLSAGSLISLTPRRLLLNLHILTVSLPCIAADLWIWRQQGLSMAFLTSIFTGFMFFQGRQLHSDFWKALDARKLLEPANKMAEAESEDKSLYLANMSHELRTPMNGILGMTELALDSELSDDQRDLLETSRSSAETLLRLLNDLLDFSKIDAKKLEFEEADFNPGALLAETVRMFSPQAEQRGLSMDCDILPGVPFIVRGDSGRVRQILMNLIGNAVKFTHQGGIKARVALGVHSVDQRAADTVERLFSVKDTGIGIPAEKHGLVFQAFTQADSSTTRRYGGTGLGLSICTRLVEMMHGTIWVESEVGAGSTFHFTITLPVAQETRQLQLQSEPLAVS